MAQSQTLTRLRTLGKLEQVSAACHHLSFFNNVGVSAVYRRVGSVSATPSGIQQLVFTALASVLDEHAILCATLVDEGSPTAYFAGLAQIDLTQCVSFIERASPAPRGDDADPELDAILQEQHNTSFKKNHGALPAWRLLILLQGGDSAQEELTASFIFHHSIGDGISGLAFHSAFWTALQTASSATDPPAPRLMIEPRSIQLLPSLEDLHPLPIKEQDPPPPSATQLQALPEWTGGAIRAPCVSRYRTLCLSPATTRQFVLECKANGVSVTAGLASVLLTTLFGLVPREEAGAMTCIIPVSLRPWLNLAREEAQSAMGVYIDAIRVTAHRPASEEEDATAAAATAAAAATTVRSTARQVGRQITAHLTENASPSGEPYTAVAVFKNMTDITAVVQSAVGSSRDAALEVSNLGVSSGGDVAAGSGGACVWRQGRAIFSRSSVASGSAVTASVVTGADAALSIGFSWQDGVVDDVLVAELVQGVHRYFKQYTCGAPTL